MTSIGIWQRFETSVINPSCYVDPYRDVTLQVAATRPDGSVLALEGFYDGDSTWRFRVMPDQLGAWHFDATFSDGAPGIEGQFECVPSDIPGMLIAHKPNPQWFGYRGGDAVLLRSFHVGDGFFAANFPEEKRSAFLDWAKAQGYNTLSIASHYLNRDSENRGKGWETPKLWPLDALEYQKMETLLDELAERRLFVFPFAGFFGRQSNYPTDPAEQELYVRYTLARVGSYWNILLNVAGPEPLLDKNAFLSSTDCNRLGTLVKRIDPYGHPLTVHNATGDDAFINQPWHDFGTLQGPKTLDLDELSTGILKNHHHRKPLYAQETLWAGNKYHPDYNAEQLRKNAWVLLMSAANVNFADNGGPVQGEVGLSSQGFSGSMDLADRRQFAHDILKRVWDFAATLPLGNLLPRQDLVSAGYCLADVGKRYFVYLPTGGSLDVAVANSLYRITWINAQDTSDRRDGGVTADGQGLTAPAGGDDWLLDLHHC